MAQREMSGKALLDKLYSGLDTMPAVEAEMNAQDLRRLTDDFLGKPAEPTASGQRQSKTSSSASKARPASRARKLYLSLAVLSSVAFAGVIAAGVLRESDKRAALPPPPVVEAAPVPAPVVQAAEVTPPPEPVVLVNPFDKTEKFTFPPGTSKADAREQMAEMLLQRAVERRAHIPKKSRKLASEPRTPKTGHGS